MENEILVSVVMPAYNAEKYIARAIESVLEQKVELELLIIEDCSKDHTLDVTKKYVDGKKVILIQNRSNQGVAESRNIGINRAKGKYIAFLDADDWWHREKLEIQCKVMEENDVVFCCTGRNLMKADGTATGKYIGVSPEITYQMLLRTNSIPCSSVVIRRQVAKEYGMCYNELHEDYILWLRILKSEPYIIGIDQPLVMSRLSENGKSRNKLKSAGMQWGVYKRIGINFWKRVYYFANYAINGIRKYR